MQPPARSPLTGTALLRGALALARGGNEPARRVRNLLRDRYSPRALVLTDSGTGALALALKGAHDRRPGEVALPAYSCFDVVTAAVGARVPVRLYDLDPHTLGPDPESVRECLQDGVTAVVVAPLYGVPIDMKEIERLAAEHGAMIVEDAAQGAGAALEDRPLGSRGSLGVLSFGRGKGVTGGAGGGLLANDEPGREVLERVADQAGPPRSGFRELGIAAAQWALARPSLYSLPRSLPFLHLGETVYSAPGPVHGLARAAAAILEETWELVDPEAGARRSHAAWLLAHLEGISSVETIEVPEASRPGYLRLPVILSSQASEKADSAMRLGVMPGYPMPLSALPALVPISPDAGREFPAASRLADRLVTLPTHGGLRDRDKRAIERWIASLDG